MKNKLKTVSREIDKVQNTFLDLELAFKEYGSERLEDCILEFQRQVERLSNLSRDFSINSGLDIKEQIIDIILEEGQIKIEKIGKGIKISFPALLPKKKDKNGASFIRSSLYFALERFSQKESVAFNENMTVIFRQNYLETVRDHDNVETKSVIDLLALYFLETDDGWDKLSHYYCSRKANRNYTEVFLIPQSDLIYFLESGDSM